MCHLNILNYAKLLWVNRLFSGEVLWFIGKHNQCVLTHVIIISDLLCVLVDTMINVVLILFYKSLIIFCLKCDCHCNDWNKIFQKSINKVVLFLPINHKNLITTNAYFLILAHMCILSIFVS